MSQENADLVRHYFEAANERRFPEVMAMYADEVQLVISDTWLNGGTYAGKRAVGGFFGDWFRTFDGGPHFVLEELRDVGDAVAVAARVTARGGRSGIELSTHYFYVLRVRDGQIAHMQIHDNWQQALDDAGLPTQPAD
jgi:ketosteroid isomerase-like protein